MTVVSKTSSTLIRALAISATIIAACSSSATEQGEDLPDAQTQSLDERLAADAVGYREDVAVTATLESAGPEQWLLIATVTRQDDQFQIAGLKISWELPADAQVTGFDGECDTVADRQTCLTPSNLLGGFDPPLNFELLVDLPTSATDRAVIVSVTYQYDRYDYNTTNNTTTINLE